MTTLETTTIAWLEKTLVMPADELEEFAMDDTGKRADSGADTGDMCERRAGATPTGAETADSTDFTNPINLIDPMDALIAELRDEFQRDMARQAQLKEALKRRRLVALTMLAAPIGMLFGAALIGKAATHTRAREPETPARAIRHTARSEKDSHGR
jgi:hypothetical protein